MNDFFQTGELSKAHEGYLNNWYYELSMLSKLHYSYRIYLKITADIIFF